MEDLIYDVGLYDGADTAFYLRQGYRVVAVEANPQRWEAARRKFAAALDSGRLTLLNVGIAAQSGSGTFWVCEDHEDWSSFDRRIASREGSRHHGIEIRTVRFAEILREWGVPHYLKIDIEGADRLCVGDLADGLRPNYISLESECVGDHQDLSDAEALATLRALHQAGYRRFKLVSQEDLTAAGRDFAPWLTRVIRSAAYGKLRVPGLSALAARGTYRGRLARRFQLDFPPGCTGPWGEDAPGPWLPLERAEELLLDLRHRHFRRPVASHSFWYDWHATI